jgi:GTP-binding protein HflX
MTKRTPAPTALPRERAFMVGADLHNDNSLLSLEDSLIELSLLADTAGLDVVGELTQKMVHPHPQTYIGTGKVEELKTLCDIK